MNIFRVYNYRKFRKENISVHLPYEAIKEFFRRYNMLNQSNVEIGEQFLSAYSTHNWEGIRKLLHPTVKWTLPGDGAISGTAEGINAVINRVKSIVDGKVYTQLHGILVGQFGLTLALHNSAVSEDGRVLEEELATVLTIESGLITKIDTYLSDVAGMEQYFIK
jgi:ketosteroid isomerase-like protein